MKMTTTIVGLSSLLLALPTASAAILGPGDSAGLTGWSPAAGGTTLFSQSYSFQAITAPLGGVTATGTLEQEVIQQLSGELLFSLRISQLTSGPQTHLQSVLVGEWGGFQVDTDFELGSGLSTPTLASRSGGAGDKVWWSNFEGPVSDGKNTAEMQILTNAVNYAPDSGHLRLYFSDGSVASLAIAAPASIPAPGVVALLACAALSGIRRRR